MQRGIATLILLGLSACAHAPEGAGLAPAAGTAPAAGKPATAAPDPMAYFPLGVGNEWTWVDLSPSQQPGTARRRTVRIVSRDAEGFYVDDSRGALKSAHGCIQDRVRRILCAPFEEERTWTSVVSETSTERYQIAATGLTVTVPEGTFQDCILVRARNRAGSDAEVLLETTYAPGVGPVRIETFAVVGGKKVPQVKAELASHRIERAAR
ncbi:MAG: hypothetical protein WB493_07385 [Anaeromyxobacteraceae bacterium]